MPIKDNSYDMKNIHLQVGSLELGGTEVSATASELNDSVAGTTATAAEVNAVADVSAGARLRSKTVAITTLTATETNLFTLPAGAIVLDVILNIHDAAAEAETMDIGTQGTSNDPNGFFEAVPVNSLGVFSARDGVVVTAGGSETYISAKYAGAFMTRGYVVGTNAAEDFGLFVSKPWYVATADPVSYTLSDTVTSFAATVTVMYLDMA